MAASVGAQLRSRLDQLITWRTSVSAHYQQIRRINKHYHPDWKQQRREKFLKVDLPDFQAVHALLRQEMTPAEIRAFMKKRGVIPYRRFDPIVCLSDSGYIFDPYTPPEGDGVASGILEKGKDTALSLAKKGRKAKDLREIRKFDEEFDVNAFPELAQQIFVDAHNLLQRVFPRNFLSKYKDDEDYMKLHDLVTELAWPHVTDGLANKTLVWKFVESLEAPRVAHVVVKEEKKKDNKYGQITVRFHHKQMMALYDRFGRLMYGSEAVPKDVLEFVVFEKHLSDSYGKWRIHGKIIPEWKQSPYSVQRTLLVDEEAFDQKHSSQNNVVTVT